MRDSEHIHSINIQQPIFCLILSSRVNAVAAIALSGSLLSRR
jgi:hypothetical protein